MTKNAIVLIYIVLARETASQCQTVDIFRHKSHLIYSTPCWLDSSFEWTLGKAKNHATAKIPAMTAFSGRGIHCSYAAGRL